MSTRHVLVTTEMRGVFAGQYVSGEAGGTVVLEQSRMCLYWSKATRGVLGLASHGPAEGSRVSRPVPRAELGGATAILDLTPEALERWEESPWSE